LPETASPKSLGGVGEADAEALCRCQLVIGQDPVTTVICQQKVTNVPDDHIFIQLSSKEERAESQLCGAQVAARL